MEDIFRTTIKEFNRLSASKGFTPLEEIIKNIGALRNAIIIKMKPDTITTSDLENDDIIMKFDEESVYKYLFLFIEPTTLGLILTTVLININGIYKEVNGELYIGNVYDAVVSDIAKNIECSTKEYNRYKFLFNVDRSFRKTISYGLETYGHRYDFNGDIKNLIEDAINS